ncbi:hypothetical protein [[Phormidium ambiguum] IAM M-71]|uniref:hypothetical protein n=1 Tax=[Phormidium ambiguum] IAM M-71 TaxID=454136 RepID=UPI0015BDD0D7|nr:hypothetical protein [Phormidium ambiguum]
MLRTIAGIILSCQGQIHRGKAEGRRQKAEGKSKGKRQKVGKVIVSAIDSVHY